MSKSKPSTQSRAVKEEQRIAVVWRYWIAAGRRPSGPTLTEPEREEALLYADTLWGPIGDPPPTVPRTFDEMHAEHIKRQAWFNRVYAPRYLVNPMIEKGQAFSRGKPKGAAGPLKKLVRRMLERKANRVLTARQLWDACKALPDRQRMNIDFSVANAWVPEHGDVSFRRFANIVSEEKKLLR